MMHRQKAIQPLPFNIYFITVLSLTISGLVVSVYLTISHYRVYTDIGYISFCAITKAINCDTVSQSPYSILFGIPLAIWGIYGYTLLLMLLFLSFDKRADTKRFWPTIFFVSFFFSTTSVFFALISTFNIRSYCVMCIMTYGVNLLVLYYSWLIRRRFDQTSVFSGLKQDLVFFLVIKKKIFYLILPLVVSALLVRFFLPPYWKMPLPKSSSHIPTGLTEEKHPWIGASYPTMTIIEFSDYQCFQCKKMHFYLRELIEKYPGKIRIVHRHFPMDHHFNPVLKEPFHIGSGDMALLAIYALTQHKFWQMNDILFEIGGQNRSFNTKELAEKTGLDFVELAKARKNPEILQKLQMDIRDGIKAGISGTPAYVIDNKVYLGQIPSGVMKGLFN